MQAQKLSTGRQARQGDVFLIPITEIPADAVNVTDPNKGAVLAEGEVTGHFHVVGNGRMFSKGPDMFLDLNDPDGLNGGGGTLRHDEHSPIDLPADGKYKVVIQQEFHAGMVRQVQD